jgi:hypothetical protein
MGPVRGAQAVDQRGTFSCAPQPVLNPCWLGTNQHAAYLFMDSETFRSAASPA